MPYHEEVPAEFRLPPDDQLSNEYFWEVMKRISELSSVEKEILLQTYFKGYTAAEIAENLGLNEEVLPAMRHRALQNLRNRLAAPLKNDNESDWNRLTAEEFLKGYSSSDSIYDDL